MLQGFLLSVSCFRTPSKLPGTIQHTPNKSQEPPPKPSNHLPNSWPKHPQNVSTTAKKKIRKISTKKVSPLNPKVSVVFCVFSWLWLVFPLVFCSKRLKKVSPLPLFARFLILIPPSTCQQVVKSSKLFFLQGSVPPSVRIFLCQFVLENYRFFYKNLQTSRNILELRILKKLLSFENC